MAFYQILFWQDIPSQVKAWDDFDEEKIELSQEFIIKIDNAAKTQGLTAEDDYLNQWNWGPELKREGTPEEVVNAVKNELEIKLKE
jgi:hypothetical protein